MSGKAEAKVKIQYMNKRFNGSTMATIENANKIIAEYTSAGYDLTLRQLYYQFVSRDLIPNSQQEYKKLGDAINNGRLAGLISWEAIIDRTRNLQRLPSWETPRVFLESVVPQFKIDYWEKQPRRVEVWIEKDALIGVIERVCRSNDVPYFSCRGYTSQSEMWGASQRLGEYIANGQQAVVIHLGDHDSSGKDMTRDIEDRLNLFLGTDYGPSEFEVNRIALNIDQVRKYKPPPNPAKMTDPRAKQYIKQFGKQSWELDALDPKVLSDLIQKTIGEYRDDAIWADTMGEQHGYMEDLKGVIDSLD